MPSMRSAAMVAAASVASMSLFGCMDMDSITNAVSGFVDMACKNAVHQVTDVVEDQLLPQLQEKCKALRDKAAKELVNEEKAGEIERSCLDKGSVLLSQTSTEQKANYTQMCADTLNDVLNNSLGSAGSAATDFFASNNISGVYTDVVNTDWSTLIDELAKENGISTDGEGGGDKASGDADAAGDDKDVAETRAKEAAAPDTEAPTTKAATTEAPASKAPTTKAKTMAATTKAPTTTKAKTTEAPKDVIIDDSKKDAPKEEEKFTMGHVAFSVASPSLGVSSLVVLGAVASLAMGALSLRAVRRRRAEGDSELLAGNSDEDEPTA